MAKTPPFSLCNEFCVGGGGGTSDAKNVKYDNKNSGLKAVNVNDAIDELYDGMGDVGSAKNPDYNQNDSTQPDYIKNRPFYTEKTVVLDEALFPIYEDWTGNEEWVIGFKAAPEGLLNLGEVSKPIPIIAEIDDNGTIYTGNGFWDGDAILDADAVPLFLGDFILGELDGEELRGQVEGERKTLEGVTIKIFVENVKQIDKKYLPQNDVPYIYGEEKCIGGVAISGLKTGAYVLHGAFDTALGMWEFIPDFIDKPTFVNVINDGNGRVKVYWLDTDDYTDDSVCVRTMTVVDGTLVADNAISLAEIKDGADVAVELAMDMETRITDAEMGVSAAFVDIAVLQGEIAALQDAIATINDKLNG